MPQVAHALHRSPRSPRWSNGKMRADVRQKVTRGGRGHVHSSVCHLVALHQVALLCLSLICGLVADCEWAFR